MDNLLWLSEIICFDRKWLRFVIDVKSLFFPCLVKCTTELPLGVFEWKMWHEVLKIFAFSLYSFIVWFYRTRCLGHLHTRTKYRERVWNNQVTERCQCSTSFLEMPFILQHICFYSSSFYFLDFFFCFHSTYSFCCSPFLLFVWILFFWLYFAVLINEFGPFMSSSPMLVHILLLLLMSPALIMGPGDEFIISPL